MKLIVVDIEANGLDVETVEIHCVVAQIPGQESRHWRPGRIETAVKLLNEKLDEGYVLAGHNIIEYDIPILRRYGLRDPGTVYDTLVISRAAYPGNLLWLKDQAFLRKHPEKSGLWPMGGHALGAWGHRLGSPKNDYQGGWEAFNEEMLVYCIQDVSLNVTLLELLRERIPDEAALLECDVATICRKMRLHGVAFDRKAAEDLTANLAKRKEELTLQLREAFPACYVSDGEKIPKRSQESKKYKPGEEGYRNVAAGCPYTTIKLIDFNPASGDEIAARLKAKYDWNPKHFTDSGKAQVTAEILQDLPYPEAPLLAEYQEVKKILGYVAEGTNAWLKLERNGRLHGKVLPTGTVTSRASHNNPNTGNVPSRTELGHRCRGLFTASPGRVLVGADASGLQLRGLGHYVGRWDGGAFARQCETGDIHEYMRQGTGLLTRDRQKTWTYAKLFGAGRVKLGQIAIQDRILARERGIECEIPPQSKAGKLGQKTIDNLGEAIPAFAELERELGRAAKAGYLTALDGRRLPIGSEHLAISVLLQSFEACVMKKAMAIAAPWIAEKGGHFVLWVHDEFQVECPGDVANALGKWLVVAMKRAGEHFGLRVRIDGEYKIGNNWGETH